MASVNARRNPFHVLGLPVDAPNRTVVERAEEMVQTCGTSEEKDLVVWAKGELITNPVERAKYERLEPRRTDYEREGRWDDFVHEFRRLRVPAADLATDARLRPEDIDLAAALRILIRWSAAGTDALAPLFQTLPTSDADGVPRLEVRDVLFG